MNFTHEDESKVGRKSSLNIFNIKNRKPAKQGQRKKVTAKNNLSLPTFCVSLKCRGKFSKEGNLYAKYDMTGRVNQISLIELLQGP